MSGLSAISLRSSSNQTALPWLIQSITKMKPDERDSSGVALVEDNGIRITRTMNVLQALNTATGNKSCSGIGVTEHFMKFAIQPHRCFDRIVIAFDGEIINLKSLSDLVIRKGYDVSAFEDVPGAIVACILDWYMTTDMLQLPLIQALSLTLEDISGSFTMSVIDRLDKNTIIVTHKNDEVYFSEDASGSYASTNKNSFYDDTELGLLSEGHAIVLRHGECAIYDIREVFNLAAD